MRFSTHHLLVVAIAASCAQAGLTGRDALVRTLRSQGISLPPQLTQIRPASADRRGAPTALMGRGPGLSKIAALGKSLAGTGTISGTIYDHDGVTPASSINFLVVDTFGYNVGVNTYTSNGSYSATGLYPGSYTVTIAKYDSGYYFGNTFNPAAAQWIRVSAGQQVSGKDIVLPDRPGGVTPSPSAISVTISGTCYAGASTVLANAWFSITFARCDQVYSDNSMYVTTDGQGVFSGSVSLDSSAPYYALVRMDGKPPLWFDGSSVSGKPSSIVITSSSITGRHRVRGTSC